MHAIKKWCDNQLKNLDYDNEKINLTDFFSDETCTYCKIYLQFKKIVQQYIFSDKTLILLKYKKSKKTWNWKCILNSDFESISEIKMLKTESDNEKELNDMQDFENIMISIDEKTEVEE